MQTSREIVTRCLTFQYPARIPREMWTIPYAWNHYRESIEDVQRRFPSDFGGPASVYRPSPRVRGEQYGVGTYTDEWGCRFVNIQEGVHGEIKDPILKDLADWQSVKPPYETLPEDLQAARDRINRDCAASDRFMKGSCCPRPWERLQFLRGTENAMVDCMEAGADLRGLLRLLHEFYLREMELFVKTDVDGMVFMDDWGSQTQLLIPPPAWRELFKPLYRDYCELAHAHGKAVFMHTDGYIGEIYEDLVEIGVDAVNSQLFCMDLADLARRVKGSITFWGEIDRQHVMPAKDPRVAREAVRQVARYLYDPAGGIIAQFELTPGSNPANAAVIFEEWDRVHAEAKKERRA